MEQIITIKNAHIDTVIINADNKTPAEKADAVVEIDGTPIFTQSENRD